MKKFVERLFGISVASAIAAIVVAVLAQDRLQADEPALADQLRFVIGEEIFPQMVRLPFFGHLFETSSCACNPCLCRPACHCADAGEFSVDFDAATGPKQMVIVKRFDVQTGACEGACAASHCAEGACPATAKQASATTNCTGECCELTVKTHGTTAKTASGGCQQANVERLIELASDRAALAAALEAQEAIQEAKTEMFESLAGLLMEKAKLEAKLAMQAERDEFAKRSQELAVENARLKAHIELASHREEITRQAAHLALENEKLKLKVAELERQGSAGDEAPRTAKRASASKKTR